MIPDGLSIFYFEIRVEKEGEDGGHIGVGLFPTDQKLKGMPGLDEASMYFKLNRSNRMAQWLLWIPW